MKCPAGYWPKLDHHSLTVVGDATATCCDKTCELFTCSGDYVSNSAYFSNVGESNQKCCDKMCGADFVCNANYVLTNAAAPGITNEECCQAKCEIFTCTGDFWATSEAKKQLVGNTSEECCDATCAAFECNQTGGWAQDPNKSSIVGNTFVECCIPFCGNKDQVTCPAGYAVPPDMVNETNGTITVDNRTESICCEKQCKAHTCGFGWTANTRLDDEFGETDEDCCIATCAQFECKLEEGWANWTAAQDVVGSNETMCCLPTCQQWECLANESWLTNSAKIQVAGSSNEACCDRACSGFTCSKSDEQLIKAAGSTKGTTDAVCCEKKMCEYVRENMTKMEDGEYCNSLSQDVCDLKYHVKVIETSKPGSKSSNESNLINRTVALLCRFEPRYNLCKYDMSAAVYDCRDLVVA